MTRLAAIVPVYDLGPAAERCLSALAREAPGIEVRTVGPGARELNAAVAETGGEVLLFVPSFVQPLPGLVPELLGALDREAPGLAYGDYQIEVAPGQVVRQCVVADAEDLSEWSSTGYVSAIRREAFEAAGGYDPAFSSAVEYDLRLRISRTSTLVRVEAPLCRISKSSVPFGEETVKATLRRYFTPESSPIRGFGYLHGSQGEQREIQRAFEAELRARDAFLADREESLRCPHRSASPRVSVLIPVHDRAELVTHAVESVLAGTHHDFEILVVDGGSTDGTVERVGALAAGRPQIRLLHAPGNRISTSLNEGLRAARGAYIAILDSDDLYMPRTLERMVAHLEARPDEALAISYYDFIDAGGRPLPTLGTVRHLEYDRNSILRTNGAGAVRVWHRCALERLGGFDEENFGDYAEDYDMVLRLSERWAVGRVHEILYRYRLHDGNTTVRLDPEVRARAKALARRLALRRRIERRSDGAGSGEEDQRRAFA